MNYEDHGVALRIHVMLNAGKNLFHVAAMHDPSTTPAAPLRMTMAFHGFAMHNYE
jgi:hypothetical protein